jgi:hypothetical protein
LFLLFSSNSRKGISKVLKVRQEGKNRSSPRITGAKRESACTKSGWTRSEKVQKIRNGRKVCKSKQPEQSKQPQAAIAR